MLWSDDVLHACLSGKRDGYIIFNPSKIVYDSSIKEHPEFDQHMTVYCKKVLAEGPKFTEKEHPYYSGVKYQEEDPTWGLARQYLRAHDASLSKSTLNIYGPKSSRYSVGAHRTISDANLWSWLSISDQSVETMTPQERDFYQDIITTPDFYENSIVFCEELLEIVEREHEYGFTIGDLGGQEGYIIDYWNRAKNYLDAQTFVKSALD